MVNYLITLKKNNYIRCASNGLGLGLVLVLGRACVYKMPELEPTSTNEPSLGPLRFTDGLGPWLSWGGQSDPVDNSRWMKGVVYTPSVP